METKVTRKKFEIINKEPPYEPRAEALPLFATVNELGSDYESASRDSHRLYLTQTAMSRIRSYIGWGQLTHRNCVEQGGILLGQAYRDLVSGITYGIVQTAVAARSTRASSVHLEMTHETWAEMLASADQLLEESPPKELQVIGWYHTHPNGLQVYMSDIDRETQRRLFAWDWQFAIVLNPQKECWRAFFGGDARECRGHVIAEVESEIPVDEKLTPALLDGPPVRISLEPKPDAPLISPKSKLRERLRAWLGSPRRLLQICLSLLVLLLVLQIAIVTLIALRRNFG